MATRVSSLDVWTPKIRDVVRRRLPADFEITFAQTYDRQEQAALVASADMVLTGLAPVTGDMIRASPSLRMIQKWGVGFEKIDLAAAREAGVVVAITAGANAGTVAEHAIMLMLAVLRRLSMLDRSMREGRWLFNEMRERCFQVRGKTVGLLGFGHIGRMVARKLAGFDVSIIYHDPVRPGDDVERSLGATAVAYADLLARSDILSLHLPGGGANANLIDARAFAQMKDGAVLINTARGDIVVEADLRAALDSGKLMGAGLDVYAAEPPRRGPLADYDQVVLTPHTAGSVFDNVENVAEHAFGNMLAVLRGERLRAADAVVAADAVIAAEEPEFRARSLGDGERTG